MPKDDGSGTYGKQSVPTLPMMPRVREPDPEADEPTKVRCPTCAGVTPKLGCQTCVGEGFITYERYLKMTTRCPVCVGGGRVTNEQAESLAADAKRRENER